MKVTVRSAFQLPIFSAERRKKHKLLRGENLP